MDTIVAAYAAALKGGMTVRLPMSPAFKIYQDEQGSWHWQLQAGDGQVMATCGQGFTSRDACLEGVAFVRTVAPLAETRDDEFPTANEGQPGVFIDRSLP